MKSLKWSMAVLALGAGMSGFAQAALQGRDLDGNLATFEAYYDTVLDITWLADANYAQTSGYDADGAMTWAAANSWAASLSFTDGVKVFDDWRLPYVAPIDGTTSFNYTPKSDGSSDVGYSISAPSTPYAGSTGSELAYMFYNNLNNPSHFSSDPLSEFITNGACDDLMVPATSCLYHTAPFDNLQPSLYWTGAEYEPDLTQAWFFDTYYGGQGAFEKSFSGYAWAVHDGDVTAVPEAEAYVLMLAGLGLIGWRVRRRG